MLRDALEVWHCFHHHENLLCPLLALNLRLLLEIGRRIGEFYWEKFPLETKLSHMRGNQRSTMKSETPRGPLFLQAFDKTILRSPSFFRKLSSRNAVIHTSQVRLEGALIYDILFKLSLVYLQTVYPYSRIFLDQCVPLTEPILESSNCIGRGKILLNFQKTNSIKA